MIILVDITSRLSYGFSNVSLKLLSHIFHLNDSYKQNLNVIKPHAKTAFLKDFQPIKVSCGHASLLTNSGRNYGLYY